MYITGFLGALKCGYDAHLPKYCDACNKFYFGIVINAHVSVHNISYRIKRYLRYIKKKFPAVARLLSHNMKSTCYVFSVIYHYTFLSIRNKEDV